MPRLKSPRSKPVPAGGGQHFDAGEPRRRGDRELDEVRGRYIPSGKYDPEARAAVIAWLVRLFDEAGER